jgi:hypothetical protein
MNKKRFDRQPDKKPAEQGAGKYDPTRPMPDRKAPKSPKGHKDFGKPEGSAHRQADPEAGTLPGEGHPRG